MDLKAIEEREYKARAEVSAVCLGKGRGGHEWTMCIPPDLNHDSDIVICDSLNDIPALVARVKALEAVAEAARDYIQHVGMWNDNMAHRHPCVIQDREESTWDCWINQKLELALIALDTLNPTESDTPSGRD